MRWRTTRAPRKEAYEAAPKAPNGKVDASAAPATSDPAQAERAGAAVEDELGDVFFSLVNVGRRMGIDAESALRSTCAKFRRRWAYMEEAAQKQGRRVEDLEPDEREALWNQSKANV